MPEVTCIICGSKFSRFRFSNKCTCSRKCYRIASGADRKKTVECANCGKKFQASMKSRRVTCTEDCRRILALKNANEVVLKRAQEQAEADKRKAELQVVRSYAQDVEPRRKCAVCSRRVRLFSTSGVTWLRAHKVNGELCPGSREVVSYPGKVLQW